MIDLLLQNSLLLLFVVAALGYVIGRIKVRGVSLGVSAVLFVGLFFGALHPDLKLPEIIYTLGLVLFVYTIGLSSARGFFAAFGRKGLRDNALVLGMLILAALLAAVAHVVLSLGATLTAGLYAGSLTNTPALAAVLEQIKGFAAPAQLDQLLAEPVIGYSVTYPMGVVGLLIAIGVLQRVWRIDYRAEEQRQRDLAGVHRRIFNRTIRVTKSAACAQPVHELIRARQWAVVFGRVRRDAELTL